MENVETERKFIIDHIPDNLDTLGVVNIQQGYVHFEADFELRVRKKENKFFQTIKTGSGISRTEIEFELTENQFKDLWILTEGKRIEKNRFEIQYGRHIIELDVFSGKLENLIVAEVEFDNQSIADSFEIPEWFGKEVTFDEAYKNKNLALKGIP